MKQNKLSSTDERVYKTRGGDQSKFPIRRQRQVFIAK